MKLKNGDFAVTKEHYIKRGLVTVVSSGKKNFKKETLMLFGALTGKVSKALTSIYPLVLNMFILIY